MSDIKNPTRYTGVDRRAPRPGAAGTAGVNGNAPFKAGGRHAAITTNLYSFHSYKNWADKIRGSWDEKK